jgi:imidazole glycerol-phosphate synthase subunit HisH
MAKVAIIDYGMGNVRSVHNAVAYCGHDADITRDPQAIRDASHIILPGVGAFGDAMQAIRQPALVETLEHEVRRQGKPFLGICLGMQVLGRSSTEHTLDNGAYQGLGWFDADIVRINPGDAALKIPHMGWNRLTRRRTHPVLQRLRDQDLNFYFVHSFQMHCDRPDDVVADTDYGERITAIIARENIVAAQFHPEKSQDSGIEFLGGFLDWAP